MSIRQVYDVENQDWLGPESALTDQEAYDAIVGLYDTVTDTQWRVACADLGNAGLPVEEQHRLYVEMLAGDGTEVLRRD